MSEAIVDKLADEFKLSPLGRDRLELGHRFIRAIVPRLAGGEKDMEQAIALIMQEQNRQYCDGIGAACRLLQKIIERMADSDRKQVLIITLDALNEFRELSTDDFSELDLTSGKP